jgi:hypothetical protein
MPKIYYSQRKKILQEAISWLEKNGANPITPLNIVTALASLGYLKKPDKEEADDSGPDRT